MLRLRGGRVTLAVVLILMVTTACTVAEEQPEGEEQADGILDIALQTDFPPDPATYYGVEGLQITTTLYEGLVRQTDTAYAVEPLLAESWEVSPDGQTYTFHLRSGVRFHDGSEMDSTAVKESFERFVDVGGGPSYMLSDVASMETPDALTFVVGLQQPSSTFLPYLATAYGPKVYSSALMKEHAGSDLGQTYLNENSLGTGPYSLADHQIGSRFVLQAFEDYWGGPPYFETVNVSVIPDISTQRLKLESGELDMILWGLPSSDIASLASNPDFEVIEFPSMQTARLHINPDGAFNTPELRDALRSAIDREAIVEQVWGDYASVSEQVTPPGSLPPGLGEDRPEVDPSRLESLTPELEGETVEIVHGELGEPTRRQTELVGAQLEALGLRIRIRTVTAAEFFGEIPKAEVKPDVMSVVGAGDGIDPDSSLRIYFHSDGPVNWSGCSIPQADQAMDAGLHSTSADQAAEHYGRAAELIAAEGCVLNIADVREVIVARKGIENVTYDVSTARSVRLGELSAG